ncbi:hypothetical protein ACEPPN_016838 [Leptodophora sp. 'Broadleaf-Isolate-01']
MPDQRDWASQKVDSCQVENVDEMEKGSQDPISQSVVSADVQRRIRRQFDKRVLPIVCCLYVLSYLDRGNIGNAKTAGAQAALGLDSAQVSNVHSMLGDYKLIVD